MNLNVTVGQAACRLLCRFTQSMFAAFAQSDRLLRVNQSKEVEAVRV